jgi:hypothetical protein
MLHQTTQKGAIQKNTSPRDLLVAPQLEPTAPPPVSAPSGLVVLRASPNLCPTSRPKALARSLLFPSLLGKQQRLCLPPLRQMLDLLGRFWDHHSKTHTSFLNPPKGAWLRHADLRYEFNRAVLPQAHIPLEQLFFIQSKRFGSDFRLVCEEKALDFLVVEGPITRAFVKQGLLWVHETLAPTPTQNGVFSADMLLGRKPSRLCVLVDSPI